MWCIYSVYMKNDLAWFLWGHVVVCYRLSFILYVFWMYGSHIIRFLFFLPFRFFFKQVSVNVKFFRYTSVYTCKYCVCGWDIDCVFIVKHGTWFIFLFWLNSFFTPSNPTTHPDTFFSYRIVFYIENSIGEGVLTDKYITNSANTHTHTHTRTHTTSVLCTWGNYL